VHAVLSADGYLGGARVPSTTSDGVDLCDIASSYCILISHRDLINRLRASFCDVCGSSSVCLGSAIQEVSFLSFSRSWASNKSYPEASYEGRGMLLFLKSISEPGLSK
jgi:hypothetical protein